MAETMPQNAGEAAYTAYALVDELIGLLVSDRILLPVAVDKMLEFVAKRLSQENNFASEGAALFLAKRMARKK